LEEAICSYPSWNDEMFKGFTTNRPDPGPPMSIECNESTRIKPAFESGPQNQVFFARLCDEICQEATDPKWKVAVKSDPQNRSLMKKLPNPVWNCTRWHQNQVLKEDAFANQLPHPQDL
jgi:hypothetical protein